MRVMLKRGLVGVCLAAAVVMSVPTPASAAEDTVASSDGSRAQPAGVCELLPILWWCKK